MRDLDALKHFYLLKNCFRCGEKSQQAEGDGDVHPQRAPFRVTIVRAHAAKHQRHAERARDERRGMNVPGGPEAADTEEDEQESENYCDARHGSSLPMRRNVAQGETTR